MSEDLKRKIDHTLTHNSGTEKWQVEAEVLKAQALMEVADALLALKAEWHARMMNGL